MRWLVCLWLALWAVAAAQDPLDAPAPVPPGVSYRPAPAAAVHAAADCLREVLAPLYRGSHHCVSDVFLCGPFLWTDVRDDFRQAGGFPTTLIVPNGSSRVTLRGHGFQQSPAAAQQLEAWLRRQLHGDFTVRKLTGREIAALAAEVSYPLEEPILMVAGGDAKERYVFQFVHGQAFFVDDYSGLEGGGGPLGNPTVPNP